MDAWCRYDICLNCEISDIRVNIDDNPKNKKVIEWSEPAKKVDSYPSFKDKFIPKDSEGNELQEVNLIKEFKTNSLYVRFRVQCYQTETGALGQQYTSIIRSARGLHLGTIKGENCLNQDNLFKMAFVHITKGTETMFSRDLKFWPDSGNKEWFCWYYGCKKPEDHSVDTHIYYFYHSEYHYAKMDWDEEKRDTKNQCRGLKRSEILLKDTDSVQDQGVLVAKYVRERDPKYELHCYQKVVDEKYKYFFVIREQGGQHVLTITGHDCTFKNDFLSDKIYVDIDTTDTTDESKDFIIVGTVYCMYSICKNCEPSDMTVYHDYQPNSGLNWQEVPIGECPSFKSENVEFVEDETKLIEANLVMTYINDNNSKGRESILLYCYGTGGTTDNKKEYSSVLKTLDGTYLVTVKGLDCSSNEMFSNNAYLSYKKDGREELLFLGTRSALGLEFGPWCEYHICISCETVKVSSSKVSDFDMFKWSKVGIQLNSCPSRQVGGTPKDSAGNQLPSTNIIAEYVEAGSLSPPSFVLDCYVVGDGDTLTYYLSLRTTYGLHIAMTPSRGCSMGYNLMRKFYLYTKNKDNKVQLYKTGQPATELCWNSDSESTSYSEIWLYIFYSIRYWDADYNFHWWKIQDDKPYSCRSIKSIDITMADEEILHGNKEVMGKYVNGGKQRFTLTCYKVIMGPATYYFATIYDAANKHVVTIKSFDCSSPEEIIQMLYVNTLNGNDDTDSIVLGSRQTKDKAWCFYAVHKKWQGENVWVYRGYEPITLVSQWYKEESQHCPAVKRDNVITDENEIGLETKKIDSVYVVEMTSKKAKEGTFLNYCYYEENTEGVKIYYLVIRTMEGDYVAAIKDFDCSSTASPPLSEKIYMYEVNTYGEQTYAAFGSRASSEDSWCRYDICLGCEVKEVRNNIDSVLPETTEFRWSEPGVIISNSPSLKNQKPMLNAEDPVGVNDHDVTVYVSLDYPYLVVNCHLLRKVDESGLKRTQHAVVRTNMGRHITTFKRDSCATESSLFELGYVLVQKKDKAGPLRKLDRRMPPKRGEDTCWFYGCEPSDVLETRLFIFNKIPEGRIIWKETKKKALECPRLLEKSTAITIMESLGKTGNLVAKYSNGERFQLECYLEIHIDKFQYVSVIKDSAGEVVTSLEGLECSSINQLQNSLHVFVPTKYDYEEVVDLVGIGISTLATSNTYCSHIICRNCEAEHTWDYYTASTFFQSDWASIATDICLSLPKEDIIRNEDSNTIQEYSFIATYLNRAPDDDNMLVLDCFQKIVSSVRRSYIAQLKTLKGEHIAYIKGLSCSSSDIISSRTYMSVIKKPEEKHYLALGTRTVTEYGDTPWCRYDVCINNCGTEALIQLNVHANPQHLSLYDWSMEGVKLNDPSEKSCVSREIKEENKLSKFANRMSPWFSIDCHEVKDANKPDAKKYCSVIMKGDTQLGTIPSGTCIVESLSIKSFYVYSLYENKEYTLVKLGEEEKSEGEKPKSRTIKENWLYYFKSGRARIHDWKLVSNPKVSLMKSIGFPKKDCLPRNKKPKDLGFSVDQDASKNKKSTGTSKLSQGSE